MKCRRVRSRLSAYRDRDLGSEGQLVAAHLAGCAPCAEQWRLLTFALDDLAESPRLRSPEGVASRVLARLEVESRGPGLALLFRPAWAARPLMLPSLIPAAFVLASVVAVALSLSQDPGPLPPVAAAARPPSVFEQPLAPLGSESNPFFPSDEVSVPRARGAVFAPDLLAGMAEGTVFVETVVARDGSVSTVNLLGGDRRQAEPLLAALRRERYEPGRFRGRPVAVSVYRLISRMEVRAPLT